MKLTKIPGEVMEVLQKLQNSGFESYLVGGCVRDLLLDRTPKDFDICTSAAPNEVKAIFNRVFDTGIKFGMVSVLTENMQVEVTTFRGVQAPKYYRIKTLCSDRAVTDVHLRDFTINAILFDGERVIDCVGGRADLKNKLIKTVGEPEDRYREDPLRMLRAIRLANQLDLRIELKTEESIITHAEEIIKVSPERVRDELAKILLTASPSRGINRLRKTGLLQHILPELQNCVGFEQKNPHHDKDVFEHTLAVLDKTPNNLVIRLAAVLHDVAKPNKFSVDDRGIGHFYGHDLASSEMAKAILKRLRFDNNTVQSVTILVKEHMNMPNLYRPESVKKWLNRVGKERVGHLLELKRADIAGSTPPFDFRAIEKLRELVADILAKAEPLSVNDLAIGGRDLIELGLSPGPEIGRILNKLLSTVLTDPECNRREYLLELVRLEGSKG